MALSGLAQESMARMKIAREATCGMNWSESSSTGVFHGVALEILTLFVFQVSVWDVQG